MALEEVYTTFTCADPDPYSEYGFESTKLLNTDSIWIRIHNTDLKVCQISLKLFINQLVYVAKL